MWIIGAHRAADDEEKCFVGRAHTNGLLCSNLQNIVRNKSKRYKNKARPTERRPDIQAMSRLFRDPVLVDANKLFDEFKKRWTVESLCFAD